jgi:hypothetical protein
MKKHIFTLMIGLSVAVYMGSCKKDKKDEPTPTPAPVINYLCDGDGTTSYYPLDSLNTWTYAYSGMMVSNSTIEVTGSEVLDGKKYAVLTDGSLMMFMGERYLREDASTHNIYRYSDYYHAEFLEVPASPTLNQTWTSGGAYSRKVTNLSASKTTSSCSYTGLLEITEYQNDTLPTDKFFYKKGLGLICNEELSGFWPGKYTITAANLK